MEVCLSHTGVTSDPGKLMKADGGEVGPFDMAILEEVTASTCSTLKELSISSGVRTDHLRFYGILKYAGRPMPIPAAKELVRVDYEPFSATSVPKVNGRELKETDRLVFSKGFLWAKP